MASVIRIEYNTKNAFIKFALFIGRFVLVSYIVIFL